MKRYIVGFSVIVLCGMFSLPSCCQAAIVIDHNCTDLNQIPVSWINTVKANIKWHYAHTSHGSQLQTGLQRTEDQNSFYDIAIGYSYLPDESNTLCIFDGQEHETYVTPELYWQTAQGRQYTQDVLDHNPSINSSGWAWCCQLDDYSESDVNAYLTYMSELEAANPGVRFIYMTGNAQAEGQSGYTRWTNNERIRQYCNSQNKVLFDFADLDAWWYNPSSSTWEFSSYEWNQQTVPVEHPQFNGDEAGHTTYGSCEQKGRAVWWMLAEIAGWNQSGTTPTPTPVCNTPTPMPTTTPPECDTTGASIWMPAHTFYPDDPCSCYVTVCNAEGYSLENFPLFVVLDILDSYFFAPSFSQYDNYLDEYPSFPPGNTVVEVFPEFLWPHGTGYFDGAYFYAGLTNPGVTTLFGEMDSWEFSWTP